MAECEVCGNPLQEDRRACIDGVVFRVCPGCLRLGREVPAPSVPRPRTRPNAAPRTMEFPGQGAELAGDFGQRLKKAREAGGLTMEELAASVREHATHIRRAEHGIDIGEKSLRKLERFFGITLFETPEAETKSSSSASARPSMELTLGDIAEIRRRNVKGRAL